MPETLYKKKDAPKASDPPDVANYPRRDLFGRVASAATRFTGGRWGFLLAFGSVAIWCFTGPLFHFSEAWQLVINTWTSIVTFLMVFLIQNAQNRDSKSLHLKLDELILSTQKARNELIDVEKLTEEQLDRLSERYRRISAACHENIEKEEFLDAGHVQPPPNAVAEPARRKGHMAVK
jgi:low affinity Fe/Cu permease